MRAMTMAAFLAVSLISGRALAAQTKAPAPAKPAATAKTPEALNIKEYINLLREDVSAEKAKLLGAVMQFDAEDAAKFWPIYREYDSELKKIDDMKAANILEYSRSYNALTDEKADELIKTAMSYQKQRDELLGKYYEQVKQQLGAVTAARFVQVEHQLLTIIDLEIASSLPVVGS